MSQPNDARVPAQEPAWLAALRAAAQQRPRTQFQRVRWSHLQHLLREYDLLWNPAPEVTRDLLLAAQKAEDDWPRTFS
jgi:hypothetical protein